MATGKISGDPLATTAVGVYMAAIQGGANVQAPSTLFAANQFNLADLTNPGQALLNLGGLSSALAASTYLTQVDAASTYLTIAAAAAGYQPLDADLTAWAAVNPSSYSTTAQIAAAYQPLAANLTSWAGVTRAAGFDTFTATPSSANLRALLSDEVGTGAAYFVGGALGTPASGTATNLTGLPITGITSSTSAQLATLLTDELGTGSAVFESAVPLVAPEGRLTLTTLVPVTTSDVTGATSIYYTPAAGDRVPIYNGTRWTSTVFTELTLALDPTAAHTGYQQSGKIFDLFVINDAGTIRLASGPAWTSDTGRGTGAGTTELQMLNGVLTNKNSLATARFGSASGNTVAVSANQATYVGSFRAIADGQAADTLANRLLFNAYNQAVRPMGVYEGTASYAYSTATWRQTNAAATNQLGVLCGLAGIEVSVKCSHMVSTSSSGLCYTGIGLDSTTAPIAASIMGAVTANATGAIISPMYGSWEGFPGLGYHYLAWLERAFGTGAQTWYGGNGATYQNGIIGKALM